MSKTREEKKQKDCDGYIERRMESAYIKCPCCGKHLQFYLVSDEERGIIYDSMPDHCSGKVYMLDEEK